MELPQMRPAEIEALAIVVTFLRKRAQIQTGTQTLSGLCFTRSEIVKDTSLLSHVSLAASVGFYAQYDQAEALKKRIGLLIKKDMVHDTRDKLSKHEENAGNILKLSYPLEEIQRALLEIKDEKLGPRLQLIIGKSDPDHCASTIAVDSLKKAHEALITAWKSASPQERQRMLAEHLAFLEELQNKTDQSLADAAPA